MSRSKALIFDIDGTAIDTPTIKDPSKALVDAIERAKDTYFICAATGRAWSFAGPTLKALGLTDPCIISGGTQICDPLGGKIIWQCNLPREALNDVLAILAAHNKNKLLIDDHTYDDYLGDRGVSPRGLHIDHDVYMLNYAFVDPNEADELKAQLEKVPGITCTLVVSQRSGLRDMHISNIEATKEHAVFELCRLLNIDRKDTIGAGDGHNDIHLFNAVGTKVAVGNAVPELKAAADKVIGAVSEDGLAHFIAELV